MCQVWGKGYAPSIIQSPNKDLVVLVWRLLQRIYPVVMNLLEVFVDGIVT